MPGPEIDKLVVLARGLGTRMRQADDTAALDQRQAVAADAGIKALIPLEGQPEKKGTESSRKALCAGQAISRLCPLGCGRGGLPPRLSGDRAGAGSYPALLH